MNRKTRFIIAVIVTLVLAVAGTTVWAGSKEGSLGHKIHYLKQRCNTTINMGDATFTMTVAGKPICDFEVTRTKVPNSFMLHAPYGLDFISDGFIVEGGPDDGIGVLEVCFAYSPRDEKKNAQIYAVFGHESAILPDVKEGTPAMLCAATYNKLNGVFAMVGNN
jgi:hypothetical protein